MVVGRCGGRCLEVRVINGCGECWGVMVTRGVDESADWLYR